MNRIHFEVPGNPKAQKRHRDRGYAKGKYDPSASDKADFLALCMAHAPKVPLEGAVVLSLVSWMPIPKGKSKKFKLDVEDFEIFYENSGNSKDVLLSSVLRWGIAHIKSRYDVDNNLKFVMDALTGVYWKNDGQVQVDGLFKIYSHRPRTELEIIY